MPTLSIAQGDCLSSLAVQYGFDWRYLWNLPENEQLRELRKNPNVLMSGDQIFIPEPRQKTVFRATDQLHVFRITRTSRIWVRLMAYGRPRGGIQYQIMVDAVVIKGLSDPDGYIEARIPACATNGQLTIYDEDTVQVYDLHLGHLDPHDEISGVQQRLSNLGFQCAASGEFNDETRRALRQFQQSQDLAVSDDLDDKTRDRLRTTHGA